MKKFKQRVFFGVILIVIVAGIAGQKKHPAHHPPTQNKRITEAITYARHQIGKPYRWGGPTQPGTSDGFDCSGLTMMAWASAGITIPRTSEDQWAQGKKTATPEPGDLVYFHGGDGQPPPAHVALVIGRHKMIEAYATGFPVRISTFGLPTSPAGDQTVWGYTRPG